MTVTLITGRDRDTGRKAAGRPRELGHDLRIGAREAGQHGAVRTGAGHLPW